MPKFEVFYDREKNNAYFVGGDFCLVFNDMRFQVYRDEKRDRYELYDIEEFVLHELFMESEFINIGQFNLGMSFLPFPVGSGHRVAFAENFDWDQIFLRQFKEHMLRFIYNRGGEDELVLKSVSDVRAKYPWFLRVFHAHFKEDDGSQITGFVPWWFCDGLIRYMELYLKYLSFMSE